MAPTGNHCFYQGITHGKILVGLEPCFTKPWLALNQIKKICTSQPRPLSAAVCAPAGAAGGAAERSSKREWTLSTIRSTSAYGDVN